MAQTNFGPEQLVKTTPNWARWMFRIVFMFTTAATAYLAATDLLPKNTKYEVTLILKLLVDPVVYGLSKMFGVKVKEEEEEDERPKQGGTTYNPN